MNLTTLAGKQAIQDTQSWMRVWLDGPEDVGCLCRHSLQSRLSLQTLYTELTRSLKISVAALTKGAHLRNLLKK